MATNDNTTPVPTETVQPTVGKSDNTIQSSPPEDISTDPILDDESGKTDDSLTDADKALASKATAVSTGNDFYDKFIAKREEADFSQDLQSVDTYWKNRPEDRKKYEEQYGDKAEDKFKEDYKQIETVWRKKLDTETDKAVLSSRYEWLFGDDPSISYDEAPVFALSRSIFNGSKRLDTMVTDKDMSDMEAAIAYKSYINDSGEPVELRDDEKWYKHSRGTGTVMNADDPRHRSKDGREIVAFEYQQFDPEFRGTPSLKAIYDGDTPTGQIVSMWDTTNSWLMKGNGKTAGSIFNMLPHVAVRTGLNLTADIITGTTAMINSVANLVDVDDSGNALIDAMNNTASVVKARKMSTSEYDQSKLLTTSNMLDFVAQVASQLYIGAGLYKGVNALTKVLFAGNPLLTEAAALKKAGDLVNSGRKIAEFEYKYGKAARAASLVGLTLATGDQIVSSARQAGFNEDEVAGIYIAYFGAMMGANVISERMISPYFEDATAAPLMRDIIKDHTSLLQKEATDKGKFLWAKSLVRKMSKAVSDLPALGKVAGHMGGSFSERQLLMKSVMARGINEAIEEEAENVGQAAVELLATQIAKRTHKGEDKIPKFDTFLDEGYWARQLPNIVMSGLGGFMGGAMTHFMPGMVHENEESFLIKGDDKARMMKIAMTGGHLEEAFFKTKAKQKASGAMGSNLLSVKINDKTGEFYKMTDPEAADTISHAEAADRAITNQYLYYKTLYGGAKETYDEIIKNDPKLFEELDRAKGHVLHQQLTDLHNENRKLITSLNVVSPPPGAKAKDKSTPVTKEDKPVEPAKPVDQETVKPGSLTVEPTIEDPNDLSKYDKAFADEVRTRAALFGTNDLGTVRMIIQNEKKIEDILSGNAAAQQVVRSVIRNKKINVFMEDGQKDILTTTTNTDGSVTSSPYSEFKDDLVDMIFSADRNLAAGHAIRHKDYIRDAKVVGDILKSNFTEKDIRRLADGARKKPKTIAIDRETTQLQKLADGVDKILTSLIGNKELDKIVTTSKSAFGIDRTIEEYNTMIANRVEDALAEGTLPMEGAISETQLTQFVNDNLEIIHKASISTYLDELILNPVKFLTAQVNTDKTKFREELVTSMIAAGSISVLGEVGEYSDAKDEAQKNIDKLLSEMETLRNKEVETSADKIKHEREIEDKQKAIAEAYYQLSKAKESAKLEGNIDMVLANFGAATIEKITNEGTGNNLPVVRLETPEVKTAQELIVDYNTIIDNIAPVVPTTPKLGAVYNLLNEISIDGKSITSTINKLINETDETQAWTKLSSGAVVKTDSQPTVIERLESMIDGEEFRDIEGAKRVLDAINIRIGQVETITAAADYLRLLQKYSQEHIVSGKNRYDALPRFMSEYIVDAERYGYLTDKPILTPEEDIDLADMNERLDLLVNYQRPDSVHARLQVAKTRVERLIEMGKKSLDKNERFKIYKGSIVKSYNNLSKSMQNMSTLPAGNKKLEAAIAKFTGLTDRFTESDEDTLAAGKEALDDVLRAVYDLPMELKEKYINAAQDFISSDTRAAERSLFISSMATSVDEFNRYYNEVLQEVMKDANAFSPTHDQEQMIRQVFSFMTDKNKIFDKIPLNNKHGMLFVNGGSGTGKTTMIGYAVTAAQKYADAQIEKNMPLNYKPTEHNGTIFAAQESHQAEVLKSKVEATKLRPSTSSPMNKTQLFNFLTGIDKSNGNLNHISTILFDEATFIQGHAEDGESELEVLHNLITKFNTARPDNPIKFIGIGDKKQGGWQVGMPTVMNPGNPGESLDYDALGSKQSMYSEGVISTDELTYSFRNACEKIDEINKSLLKVSEQFFASTILVGGKKATKLTMAYGTIGNDLDRRRLGGVQVTRKYENLYNDSDLVNNITKQLAVDKKFSVIIVDNDITNIDQLPEGAFKALVLANKENFTLRNIESVQGGEADYVVANLGKLFPSLPITNMSGSAKLQKAAMVVARARLFAKILVPIDVPIETVDKAIIMMLPPADAKELSERWDEFYLQKLRKVDVVRADIKEEEVKQPEVAPSTDTHNEVVEQAPLPTVENTEYIAPVSHEVGHAIAIEPELAKVITKDYIDDIKADAIVAEQQAIVDNPKVSEEVKAKAIRVINETLANTEEIVDLIGEPSEKAEELAEIFDPAPGVKKTATEEMRFLLDELGYLAGYSKISDNPSNDAVNHGDPQNYMRVEYASDIFGANQYKDPKAGYTPTQKAIDAAREAVNMMLSMERGNTAPSKGYNFFLTSFQTHVNVKGNPAGKEVVVHQIYAQKGDGLKVPLLMLPYDSISEGPTKSFLHDRTVTIEKASNALKALAKLDKGKPMFIDKPDNFGVAGVAMSDAKITEINSLLAETGIQFPTNTATTKIGRTSLSDEKASYRDKKITLANRGVGTFYMETKLNNIEKVFQAVTPGAPIRSSEKSKIKYAALHVDNTNTSSYINSLWTGEGNFHSSDTDLIKEMSKIPKGQSISSTVFLDLSTRLDTPLKSIAPGKTMLSVKLGATTYNILTFVGTSSRNISLFSKDKGKFELLFGFNSDGTPIKPEGNLGTSISEDLEATAFINALGNNSIDEKLVAGKVLNVQSVNDANMVLGALQGYTLDDINKLKTKDAKLQRMSLSFMNNKMIRFSDARISFKDFKVLMKDQNVQLSEPVAWTKTTKGGHEGKTAVLYTFHPKSKYDLSNPKELSKILSRLAINKATKMTPEEFNAEQFTKYGIGVVMLDSKQTSIREMLTKFRGKDMTDMNRSSSPVRSTANQRLINFVKGLTTAVFKVQNDPHSVTHNRLAKMGIESDTTTVFDANTMNDLTERLKELRSTDEVVYNSLYKLLVGITADANLGDLKIASFDAPDTIRELLSEKDPIERMAIWDRNFGDETKWTPEERKSIKDYELSRSNLSVGTEQAAGKSGIVSGLVIIDGNTKKPQITNQRNALTFVQSGLLGTDGAAAVFHMTHFITQLSKVAGDPVIAERLANEIDLMMTNYTLPGTLNRGVSWYGRLSTILDPSLGMSIIKADDADETLTTSVKEINEPAMLISVTDLIKDVQRDPTKNILKPQKGKVETTQEKITKINTQAETILNDAIDKIKDGIMMSTQEKMVIQDKALQDISGLYLDNKGLFNPGESTTIVNDRGERFREEVRSLSKKESKAPVVDRTVVDELKTATTGYEPTRSADEIIRTATEDAAEAMTRTTPEDRIHALTVVAEKIAESKLSKSQKEKLTNPINEHIATMSKIAVPAGQLMINEFNKNTKYAEKSTQEQRKVMSALADAIDSGKIILSPEQLSDLQHLIKNLTMSQEESRSMRQVVWDEMNKASNRIQRELYGAVADENGKLNFTKQQMQDLTSAFRLLQNPEC